MFHKINGTHQHAGCKSNGLPMLPIVFLGACLFATVAVCAAQQADAKMGQQEMDRARRSFATRCAPCHGLDGRGGEHAPSIVNSPAAQSRSNEALNQIIRSGIPDKGMPSFHFLTNQQIGEIISYVRFLRGGGNTANLKGNPAAGSKLFFGEAGCSDCHMMNGKGGFIGSDLSDVGRTHSEEEIREMIVQPNKIPDPEGQRVTILTKSGQTLSGLVRNEDNFSIALLSEDGIFHLVMKTEISKVAREPRSMMPDDYGKKLSSTQLDDLASFLILSSAHKSPPTESAGSDDSD